MKIGVIRLFILVHILTVSAYSEWISFRGESNYAFVRNTVLTTNVNVVTLGSYPSSYYSKSYFAVSDATLFGVQQNRYIYAIDLATSSQLYSIDVNAYVSSSLSTASNVVLFGSSEGLLYLLDAVGALQKIKVRDGLIRTVKSDGNFTYLQLNNNNIKVLNGPLKKIGEGFSLSTFTLQDGMIISGDDAGVLSIVSGNGVCRYQNDAAINSSIIASGNVIVFADETGKIRAVNTNASLLWTYSVGDTLIPYPAFSPDRNVALFTTRSGNIIARNIANGSEVFTVADSSGFITPPSIVGSVIVAGNAAKKLKMYSITNGSLIGEVAIADRINSEIAITRKGLVFSLDNGNVCLIKNVNTPPYAPTNLIVNGQKNPVTCNSNRVSWSFYDEDASDHQSAYRVELSRSTDFTSNVIDTGKVLSSAVTVLLNNLTDGTFYFRVTTWDSFDALGSTSSGIDRFSVDASQPISSAVVSKNGVLSPANPINYFANENVSVSLSGYDPTNQAISSGVQRIEFNMNGSWNTYSSPLTISTMSEGSNSISFRCYDNVGNEEQSKTIVFVKDVTPPFISIAGIATGGFYKPGVSATISVNDVNFDVVNSKFDGNQYNSGTAINQEGPHTLVVTAMDKAGNQSQSSISFTIDGTAPVVAITGVSNGGYYTPGITPVVSISDTYLYQNVVTLDGMAYVLGTPVLAEGSHILTAYAVDKAGNETTRSVQFVVDGTAPQISVSGVQNNGVYNATVSIDVAIVEVNPKRNVITLDGVVVPAHSTISTDGKHTLYVESEDMAGNKSITTIVFSIDRTLPILLIGGVVEGGQYTKATIDIKLYEDYPDFTRSTIKLDSTEYIGVLTVATDENNLRYYGTHIQNYAVVGNHTIAYTVYDKANNRATGAIHFSISAPITNTNLMVYASYNVTNNLDIAPGDHKDYSGICTIVSNGYRTNCIMPTDTTPDKLALYKSDNNINDEKGSLGVWLKPNWTTPDSEGCYVFALKNSASSSIDVYNMTAYVSSQCGTIFSIKTKRNKTYTIEMDKAAASANRWYASQRWTYFIFTWDYTAGKMAIYTNGAKAKEGVLSDIPDVNSSWLLIGCGRKPGGSDKHYSFNGKLDELRIFNKALNDDEITSLYQSESTAVMASGYIENFNSGAPLASLGFTGVANWVIATNGTNKYMKATSPGEWDALSKAYSPAFNFVRTKTITNEWKVLFPSDNSGSSWREQNKVWFGLCDSSGKRLYSLLFKPNRRQDQYTSFDFELTKDNESSSLQQGLSHIVTPMQQWLKFRMTIAPTTGNGGDGKIRVYYDSGSGFVEYLSVKDETYLIFQKLYLQYKTGTGSQNYTVYVDDICVQ